MVAVQMAVTAGPDEVAYVEIALVCNEMSKQRITGDIKGHTQKYIRAALVQLTRELSFSHIKLKECVARRQRHIGDVRHVPGRYNQAARVRVLANLLQHLRDLIDMLPVGSRPRAPLHSVNRSQIAVCVSPLVPDADAALL